MTNQDRHEALRQSKLAAELSDEQCRVLSELVALRDLKDGEVLVKEGDIRQSPVHDRQGHAQRDQKCGHARGGPAFLIGAGDFADELGFMDGAVHYASLVASGDTRVLGLEREKLESLLARASATSSTR